MRKALALVVLSATIALALVAVLAGPPPSVSPRLVVLIVVDQFLYDHLTALDGLFHDGLRTLLDEGASFANAKFRHGITLTAPGHASISTGLHPSHTGITANNVYHPGLKKRVVSIFDPREKAVGGPGSTTSPRRLLAATLGDHPNSTAHLAGTPTRPLRVTSPRMNGCRPHPAGRPPQVNPGSASCLTPMSTATRIAKTTS